MKTFIRALARHRTVCLLPLLTGLGIAAYALDYLGADQVLQQVRDRHNQPGEKSGDELSKLRDELKAFSQTASNLAPAAAAARWLELADQTVKLQMQAGRQYVPGSVPLQPLDLLGALPPPAAWVELARGIAARPPAKASEEIREIGLHFLADTLLGDAGGQNRDIARLSAKAKAANADEVYAYRSYLDQLGRAMLSQADNPDAILGFLDRQLAGNGSEGSRPVQVPNLVVQVGADRAETFLRKALVTPDVILQFSEPNDTSRLAQKLALALVDQLKLPQWGLVNSLEAVDLYEAMEKHFAAPTNHAPAEATAALPGAPNLPDLPNLPGGDDNNGKLQAQVYYLLGLIAKGRADDAVTVAKQITGANNGYLFDEAFKAMEHAGYTDVLDDFFHKLLAQDPMLPYWDQYVELAAQSGLTDRMLVLLRAAIARDDLSDGRRAALHQILFKALLASDNTEEAVQELRRLASLDNPSPSADGYSAGQLGVLLARLGMLVQRPEWTEEGIGIAKKWLATPAGQNAASGSGQSVSGSLAQILFEIKRGPEAEAVLTEALTAATREGNTTPSFSWRPSPPRQLLADLALLYHQAGRNDDVLHLLEQSPDWGAGDLGELLDTSGVDDPVAVMWLHTGSSPLPVPYLAASAWLARGEKEQAQKITDALLAHFPGLDRGYELLLALQGTNALPRLDELFQHDQFEERPLIWKARLLLQENRLPEAEQTCRQAVSIDPSDGEEGRGDRMRAYAVLADIRAARGDAKEADFYREVVKAIRLSEEADQFYLAGLLKRAIAMYEEGLKHFSDAYCIQSRLAIQLSALGLNQEAEEHYRRAFELMPDSFGRVESHCFGCEKAFDGERAQHIAEQVFTKIVAERPDKPQVHYLLGYLRADEGRFNEARTNFLKAVQLDPDYLNAWVKVQEMSDQTLVPPRERDAIAFNILRLDPGQRHAHASFERVTDLAGLWNAVAAAVRHQPAAYTNLMPLAASKIALEKKTIGTGEGFYQDLYQRMEDGIQSPALAVAQNPFVQLAGQMILNNVGSQGE